MSEIPLTRNAADLKIIDEVLTLWKGPSKTWEDMEKKGYTIRNAMARLKQAWLDGEMPIITLSLANHFNRGLQIASKDIDGSIIVILTENEARQIYNRLITVSELTDVERTILLKIIRDLKLDKVEPNVREPKLQNEESIESRSSRG